MFVSLGSTCFEIGEGKATLAHYKSMFTSEFTVVDAQGKPHDVKYVTPWWRLVFDDGMFPDLNFPLERLPYFFLSKAKVDRIAAAMESAAQ